MLCKWILTSFQTHKITSGREDDGKIGVGNGVQKVYFKPTMHAPVYSLEANGYTSPFFLGFCVALAYRQCTV